MGCSLAVTFLSQDRYEAAKRFSFRLGIVACGNRHYCRRACNDSSPDFFPHSFPGSVRGKAYAFRIPIVQAGFTGWGAFVQPADSFSEMPFWQEVLIVAAGPASNFVLGGLAAIVVKWLPESLFENSVQYVGYLNLQLGRINLYPIFVLDGAKIVHGLLRGIMGNEAADVGLVAVSFFFIIYLVLRKRRRPSLEDRLETL